MTEKTRKALWGDPNKPLNIGDIKIPCYVLDDGTRVLSGRGMQSALALGQSHGALLKRFIDNSAVKPFINDKLAMELSSPIKFIRPGRGGKVAVGYEATLLVDLCEAVLKAKDNGALHGANQISIAKQCEILTRGLARVGIIALVDEVTGYVEIRDRELLQALLDKWIRDEWAKWTKQFPDDFYKELFRLRNIPYPPQSVKRPQYIGHWTNNIVYSRLNPGVLKKLKEKNPAVSPGQRKHRHHQFLTEDLGIPELQNHLSNVIFLMKSCQTWTDFMRRLNRASTKYGDTIPLDFEMEEEN